MGALCRGQTHSRAEAQKGAARRGHGDRDATDAK